MATGKPRIEQWANNGASTLDGAINDVVTSLDVVDASSFPSTGDFKIKINDEIMTVTAVSTNTFTVERGADDTAAASHSNSDAVTQVISLEGVERAYQDNYGADYTNGFPYNRILNDGATYTASDFTWYNQGSSTCTDADDGGLVLSTGVAEWSLRGKEVTPPATPWRVAAYVHLGNGMSRYTTSNTGTQAGLMMRENSSGEIYFLFIRTDSIGMWRMTNPTTFSAEVDTFIDNEAEEIWLRMGDDGVDVFGEVSYNGWDWETCFNEGRTSFMAGGPDRVGFAMATGTNADADAEVYFKSWILY